MIIYIVMAMLIVYMMVGIKYSRWLYTKQINEGRMDKNVLKRPGRHGPDCGAHSWTIPEYMAKYCTCGLIAAQGKWEDVYGHVREVDNIYGSVLVWPVRATATYIRNGARPQPDYLHIERLEKELF